MQEESKWYIEKETEDGIVFANKSMQEKVSHTKEGRIAVNCDLSLELISNQPEVFIEKGCLEACVALWDLNITTRESNGWQQNAYIVLGPLSDENMEIFKELSKKDPKHYEIQEAVETKIENGQLSTDINKLIKNQLGSKFGDCCILKSSKGFISPDLIKVFKLQDIHQCVWTMDQVKNMYFGKKEYEVMPDGSLGIIQKAVDVTKSEIENLIKEKGFIYDLEENKVYKSKFYYDKHVKYLEYLKEKNDSIGV